MRITRKVELGMACMANLASKFPDGPTAISAIAKEEGISQDYVEQILMRLRRAGLIKSVRGTRGGYTLQQKPQDITIKDIIAAIEKKAFEVICFSKNHRAVCSHPDKCAIKTVWLTLDQKINETLEGFTLQDIVAARQKQI